jgi:hypothetical protein
MSNLIFPKLSKPRVNARTFQPLVGMKIPGKCKINTGYVGTWIHKEINNFLPQIHTLHAPDISDFDIEVKTQDAASKSAISIGHLTLYDILSQKNYKNSNIFSKLQSVLFVERNDNFREITKVSLHYFDNDTIQGYLENDYTIARNAVIDHVATSLKNNGSLEYSPYQKFGQSKLAYLELDSNMSGFQFRIPKSRFKFLTNVNGSTKNNLFDMK